MGYYQNVDGLVEAAFDQPHLPDIGRSGRGRPRGSYIRDDSQRDSDKSAMQGEGEYSGTVKWFNSTKGYGFITPDDGTADIFVHHTGINAQGYRTLNEGEAVRYSIEAGRDGRPRACNVVSSTTGAGSGYGSGYRSVPKPGRGYAATESPGVYPGYAAAGRGAAAYGLQGIQGIQGYRGAPAAAAYGMFAATGRGAAPAYASYQTGAAFGGNPAFGAYAGGYGGY